MAAKKPSPAALNAAAVVVSIDPAYKKVTFDAAANRARFRRFAEELGKDFVAKVAASGGIVKNTQHTRILREQVISAVHALKDAHAKWCISATSDMEETEEDVASVLDGVY